MLKLKSFAILVITIFISFQSISFGDDAVEEESNIKDGEDKEKSLPKELKFHVLNRTDIEKECKQLGPLGRCWSSDKELWICGNDDRVYQNPGVLVCAQQCNSSIELEVFCKRDPWDESQKEVKQHCANCYKYAKMTALEELAGAETMAEGTKEALAQAEVTLAEKNAALAANPTDPQAIGEAGDAKTAFELAEANDKIASDGLAAAIQTSVSKGNPPPPPKV